MRHVWPTLASACVVAVALIPPADAATSYPTSTGSDGACDFTHSGFFDTNTNQFTDSVDGSTSRAIGANGVFNCTTLTVASTVTLTTHGAGVLDFRATGAVDIEGTIDVRGGHGGTLVSDTATGGTTGATGATGGGGAGFAGASGQTAAGGHFGGGSGDGNGGGGGGGYGGGGGGAGAAGTNQNGGNGSSGGTGGAGGNAVGAGGKAGPSGGTGASATDGTNGSGTAAGGGGGGGFGNVTIDLHPGSGGGGGGGYAVGTPQGRGGAGGGGGGAVRVVTPDALTIAAAGKILADGGDGGPGVQTFGNSSPGGGGAGSGGDIYLAAPTVTVAGTLSALGGNGGGAAGNGGPGGDGSDGRIRIFSNNPQTGSFSPPATAPGYSFPLTVTTAGVGSGKVTGDGIDCGSDCGESYDAGQVVTLTATPSGGSTFAGWSGDCTGTGACQVTMSAARSVTATFSPAAAVPSSSGGTTTNTGGNSGGNASQTQRFAGVSIVGKVSRLTRRGAPVRLRCPAGTSGACAGTLVLKTRLTAGRTLTLGRARFKIGPGKTVRVVVKISKRGRKLLTVKRRLRTTATAVAHDGQAASAATARTLTLKL